MHSLCVLGAMNLEKQVDILIYENQALQILLVFKTKILNLKRSRD